MKKEMMKRTLLDCNNNFIRSSASWVATVAASTRREYGTSIGTRTRSAYRHSFPKTINNNCCYSLPIIKCNHFHQQYNTSTTTGAMIIVNTHSERSVVANQLTTKIISNLRLFSDTTTSATLMSESQYHTIADDTLEIVQDGIDEYFDSKSTIEYEVSLSSGVLNISFPPYGVWVLNKQTPNRQIWWSSPMSGPKRFEYLSSDAKWYCSKDGIELINLLSNELKTIFPNTEDFKIGE